MRQLENRLWVPEREGIVVPRHHGYCARPGKLRQRLALPNPYTTISRLPGQDTPGSGAASITITYASTPTPGNLLVAAIFSATGSGGFTTIPTGWSTGHVTTLATTQTLGIFYRVAGVAEPLSAVFTSTGSGSMQGSGYEYAGAWATQDLVMDKTPAGSNSGGGSQVALASPLSGTTAQADELCFFAVGQNASNGGSQTWDSPANALVQQGRIMVADRIVAAIGSYSGTARWFTTRQCSGLTVTFRALSW